MILNINGTLTFNAGTNSVTLPANRGANGYVLTTDGAGNSSWTSNAGDNLGNHSATQDLDMNGYDVIDAGTITCSYLDPGYVDVNYHFTRLGNTTTYYAGLMHNIDHADFGNGNDFSIFTYGNRDLTIKTGTGNFIVFPSSGGNVGIGTTSPSAKLEVANPSSGATMHVGRVVGDVSIEASAEAANGWLIMDGASATGSVGLNYYSTGKVVLANGGGNVGVGTSSPTANMHIYNNSDAVVKIEADADNSGENDNPRLELIQDGGAVIGSIGLVGISGEIFTGSYQNSMYIINEYSDSKLYLGTNNLPRITINASGIVGIGRSPSSNRLEVEGNASKTTAGSWLANSDKRIKTEIQDIDNSLELIEKLRPVKFKYTKEWRKMHPSIENKYYYNFIAQEYQSVFPESVKGSGEYLEGDKDEILQIDTYNAQIITIKAVQELIEENRELKEEISELKKLRVEVDELKQLINASASK
ncbi:MAG: hypothetical protein C0594_09820 [Marinilabiliales bacterium]|mgnify:CR=1 FL=1|nr:MAG: hypothetical protein C0594_09820 [Marinilabiliales bacterium]